MELAEIHIGILKGEVFMKKKKKNNKPKGKKTRADIMEQSQRDIAYSSLFSFISFIFSSAGLIFDLFLNKNTYKIVSFVCLIFLYIVCLLMIIMVKRKVNKEHNYGKKFVKKLEKISSVLGYLSIPLLLVTLLLGIFRP